MESKRPRLDPQMEGQEEKHNELLVHSLLNFSESYNFNPSFRLQKRPNTVLDTGIKLAPIQSVADGIPMKFSPQETNENPFSSFKRQEVPSPNIEKSPKSERFEPPLDLQTSASLALADLPYSHCLHVITQPVAYQIANYNIHPPPALAVDRSITQNITIHAQLVENDKRTVVAGGFQSGDVRVLRAGHTTLYFTGLKLNKMGPIKTELHFRDYKRIPSNFCIQFKIGQRCIYSEPFKLVSSCAQLPQEVRDIVRPTKKTSNGSPEPVEETRPAVAVSIPINESNEQSLRRELEVAIQTGDVEGASTAARKLAFLKKMQFRTIQ